MEYLTENEEILMHDAVPDMSKVSLGCSDLQPAGRRLYLLMIANFKKHSLQLQAWKRNPRISL